MSLFGGRCMDHMNKPEKSKWKREFSAGGVVYKKENGAVFILLINPKGPNYGPATNKWSFPKGGLEEGESKEEVAVREVREEGGINAKITKSLGYIKFFRHSPRIGNALKFVDFWLMEYISGDPNDHDKEIAEAKWFPMEDVEQTLAWPTDKEIFERAKKILIQK
jgi:8-oxo-dGTP diphosphatase